ncbi:MAG TPA: efflux RND transporter periplasmic adaptor subunit, partial [Cytophagaceae bacterium]
KAAILLNKGEFLRAGYSANADIILDKKQHVLAIKEGLLQFGKDSIYVEVETSPQIFKKTLVKTGISDGINVEIKEGLTLNDKIKVFEKMADKKDNKEPTEKGTTSSGRKNN